MSYLIKPSVSVVIPCYNAQRWVGEAIRSCLAQTHRALEIILIDDGSTDDSLEVVKSYGSKVRWESGPNRGGNYARNRGFELSSGEYIQFLDADDYILSEKIERQAKFLEETGADAVYGDWRHQYHEREEESFLGTVQVPGAQLDILESLLGQWWVAPVAILCRRRCVTKCGGWDESLPSAQDRDFFIAAAWSKMDIRYQPGCYSIYRRWGNFTISTSNRPLWLESNCLVLEKAEKLLADSDELSTRYKQALAESYFALSRNYYDLDRETYASLMDKVFSLNPNFTPGRESLCYRVAQKTFGFRLAEKLASLKRSALASVKKG